jgi:hypothetical protein
MMQRLFALVCSGFLAQGLFADPAALSGTAALPLTATAAPTPRPTPTPLADLKGPSSLVRLADPSWGWAFKAGGVVPLGDLAQFNQPGPAGALDLYYHLSADVSVDGFLGYSTQGYKLGGGAQPLSNTGLGAKLLYNLSLVDDVTWYAGGGVGLYYNQRTKQIVRPVVSNAPPIYDPVPDSSLGLGILGVMGGRYANSAGWGIVVELNVVNINLAGGTSDSLLLAQPMLGYYHAL